MARQRIELALEEAEELGRRARATTVPVRDRQRAEIILLSVQGLTQQRIAEQLEGQRWQTFSTFRGHPIMIAGLRAHLRVQQRDGLAQHAQELDSVFLKGLTEIAASHPAVSGVDGRGTHWTIELHGPDWRDWYADVADAPLAARVAAAALDAGALIGTSGEQTSLFLAPPLIIGEDDALRLLEALDAGLAVADAELKSRQP